MNKSDSKPADSMLNKNLHTFDDVINELKAIIEWSLLNKSRIGFFAAIYKNVTERIKAAANNGEFQDRERIEHLDVAFASRYFTAIDDFRNNIDSQSAWSFALQKSRLRFTIILQQLLLSMNPHINIDLAVASETICPGEKLLSLYPDFLKVNEILASALLQIEKEIFSLSPLLSLVARFGTKIENKFLNFSLSVARLESWSLACQLAIGDEEKRTSLLLQSNQSVIGLAKEIISPGLIGNMMVFAIGIFEFRSIRKIIQVLNDKPLSGE